MTTPIDEIPEDEIELVPTADDERIYAEVYGFTPEDIALTASAFDVPEKTVTHIIELAYNRRPR